MPRIPRGELLDSHKVQVLHVWTRAVRRTFWFGFDPLTGADFSHREAWFTRRLKHLAQFMAVDVFAFAVLSNHAHFVFRTRPDLVKQWSDEEAAERWLAITPGAVTPPVKDAKPTKQQIQALTSSPEKISWIRKELSSVSCLMKKLCQQIAVRCNQEDGCTGRVFQDRFEARVLDSDEAVLACVAYVDLNPLRAKMVDNLQDHSDCSVAMRMRTLAGESPDPSKWLQPIERAAATVVVNQLSEEQRREARARTLSDLGGVSISLEDYVSFLHQLTLRSRPELQDSLANEAKWLRTQPRAGNHRVDLDSVHATLQEMDHRYRLRRPACDERVIAARRRSADQATAMTRDTIKPSRQAAAMAAIARIG